LGKPAAPRERSAAGVIGSLVLMDSRHPLEMTPVSPRESSTTNKDQAPLGLVPLKTDNRTLV
jgi:hypothetical protein